MPPKGLSKYSQTLVFLGLISYLWLPSWRVCCQPSRRDWCQLISSSLLPAFQWVCCPVWRWLCYKSFYKMRFPNRLWIYNTLHALISVALFTMSRGHCTGWDRSAWKSQDNLEKVAIWGAAMDTTTIYIALSHQSTSTLRAGNKCTQFSKNAPTH